MSTASDFWTGTFSLVAPQTAKTTVFDAPFGLDRLQLLTASENPDDFNTNPDTALFSLSTSPQGPQASGAISALSSPPTNPQTLTLAVMGLPGGASLGSAVLTQTSITTWTATFIVTRTGNDPGTRTYAVTATKLTPTPNLDQDFGDGSGVAVGAVSSGRLRYNNTTKDFEASLDGAAYVRLVTGGGAGGFVQNGNSFGATAVLGTNDAFGLSFETTNVVRATIAANGTTWVLTQGVATAGSPVFVTYNGAAHTTLANAEATDINENLARTVQFTGAAGLTTIALQRAHRIQAPAYQTAGAGALVLTNAATLYVDGPPTTVAGGGGTTITNAYTAYFNGAGVVAIGTQTDVVVGTSSTLRVQFAGIASAVFRDSTNDIEVEVGVANGFAAGFIQTNTNHGFRIGTNTAQVAFWSSFGELTLTQQAAAATATAFTITQPVNTGGSPTLEKFNGGAHTNLTLSVEANDVLWDLSRTVQFATGALALQRAGVFDVQVTYAFVGASTLTNTAGLHITAGPTQGANATISSATGLLIGGTAAAAAATTTLSSAAGTTFNQINVLNDVLSLTGTTNLTAAVSVTSLKLPALTINTTGAGLTITTVATLYVANAPTPGALVTLTNSYAIFSDGGLNRFDGNGTNVFEVPADNTGQVTVLNTGRIPIKTTGSATQYYLRYYVD